MTTRKEMDDFLAAVSQAASQPDDNPETEASRQRLLASMGKFEEAKRDLVASYAARSAPWYRRLYWRLTGKR